MQWQKRDETACEVGHGAAMIDDLGVEKVGQADMLSLQRGCNFAGKDRPVGWQGLVGRAGGGGGSGRKC